MKKVAILSAVCMLFLVAAWAKTYLYPEPHPDARLRWEGFVGPVVLVVPGEGTLTCPGVESVRRVGSPGPPGGPNQILFDCTHDSGLDMPCECLEWDDGDLISVTDARLVFHGFNAQGEFVYKVYVDRAYKHWPRDSPPGLPTD